MSHVLYALVAGALVGAWYVLIDPLAIGPVRSGAVGFLGGMSIYLIAWVLAQLTRRRG